jgi:chemotaxis protein CheD
MTAQGIGLPPAQGVIVRYVLPGDVVAAAGPSRFVTVLGSCVAICLYDAISGIGGMNHYLLPGTPREQDSTPCRWSDVAIDELFRQVDQLGARRVHLKAKVFGGAQITARNVSGGFRIGERNVESAIAALAARHIEVVSSSTGGTTGRKVVFEGHTGLAWVKDLQGQRA